MILKKSVQKEVKFEDVLSSLIGFSHSELLSILNETSRCISVQESYLVASVPSEVWSSIFVLFHDMNKEVLIVEKPLAEEESQLEEKKLTEGLRIIACVSTSWSSIVRKLVPQIFKGKESSISNWVLKHCTHLTEVWISENVIHDETLKLLT